MQESEHTLVRPEKTLLFSFAMTYGEFVAASQRQEFFEIRSREIRLLPEEQAFFNAYPDPANWLVVAAEDGPDSLVVLPVVAHIVKWAPRISLRVVREDEASSLLASLIDDPALLASWAEADLPLLLSFDDEWQFQEQWGPHPQLFEPLMEKWLAEHQEVEQLAEDESAAGQLAYARLLDALTYEMRLWYNSSLNQACGEELRALLTRWRSENGDEG
jgi:hypothetical protein